MQLKWGLFFLLIMKPLAVIALLVGLQSTLELTPQQRQEQHNQWVQQLFDQHRKLTDLKLIYARLPQKGQADYNKPLLGLHRLYQKAAEILQELEEVDNRQWRSLAQRLEKLSNQIQQGQSQLETTLAPHSYSWVYQI